VSKSQIVQRQRYKTEHERANQMLGSEVPEVLEEKKPKKHQTTTTLKTPKVIRVCLYNWK